jgi:RHS repeat-associated protein
VTDALGHSATISFDDSFQTAATQDPLGRRARLDYDAAHNPTSIVAPGSPPTTIGYDTRGNPTFVVDPQGQSQEFGYEPSFNRLTTWQDVLGNPTAFSYDPNGNRLSTTYADGTTEQLGYNAQGNVERWVNRRGQLVRYTYDNRGLLTRKDLPDGSHVDYHFNDRGNLDRATDATGTTVLEYLDPQNPDLVTKITYPGGRSLQYTYENGRRTRMVDQSGFAVNYHYDPAGRLDFVRGGSGNLIAGYHYDPAGRLDREDKGNGTSTTYQYDAAGRLEHLVNYAPGGVVISSRFDYTYDLLGRRDTMTTLEGTTTYGYDAVGRLTSVALPGGRTITYGYDAAGNRTVVSDNAVTTAYTVNSLNEYLTVGSTSQAFDLDGNLIAATGPAGDRSYAYDAEGRLLRVTTPQGTWTYEYDALGHRVASTHDGVRTQFLVDPFGLGDVVGEYDGAGNLVAHYTQGLGLTSRVDAGGQAAYYQFDAIGNTVQLTGGGGTVLNTYSYLPFGEALNVSETVSNPFKFVGQFGVMREGNGLDFMRNRWYDPTKGRFTQADPIGLAGGANFYAYVGNNPMDLVDPSGLGPEATTGVMPAVVEAAILAKDAARAAAIQVARAAELARSAQAAEVIRAETQAWINWLYTNRAAGVKAGAAGTVLRAGYTLPTSYLVRQALLRAGRLGAYGVIAAGLLVSAWEQYYVSYVLVNGDMPECVSYVPLALQPGCKLPQLTTGIFGGRTSTTQIDRLIIRLSADPNDIVGPAGFGPNHFVPPGTLPYTINFENRADAIHPAAEVFVTQQLDPDLDLDTFQLGAFGFGGLTVPVPAGRQFYHTRVDVRSTLGVFVDFTAELDRPTRTVTWTFTALDPATLDVPIDLFTGFLPPDHNPPEGQGFVSYSVRPRAGSPSGARIDAQASIVFDANAPLLTPLFVNTIDAGPPSSSVNPLPATSPPTFTVSWSGADDAGGSAIATYDLFVSDNGGPFTLFLSDTPQTSAAFTGQVGHTYRFFSVATDNVGHRQATPATAQATVHVVAAAPGQQFLRQVYLDLLGRPADAAGLGFWESTLGHGQSRAQVVREIVHSTEYLGNAVDGLYRRLLHRAADPGGRAYWLNTLAAGADLEQVEARFLASDEYFRTRGSGTGTGFLAALYGDVLNRDVDPGAAAYFGPTVATLGHGPGAVDRWLRDKVVGAVTTSPEAYRDLVQGFYRSFLHRPADAGGLAFYAGLLAEGAPPELVLASLIGSDEYSALAG